MAAPQSHPSTGTSSSGSQGVNMASSAITSAASAYSSYNRAKYAARAATRDYKTNKAIALESLKVNQYIIGRNKIATLDASADEKMDIEIKTMQAKAAAEVGMATFGIEGGSAQQVLHDISRASERAEGDRLYALDTALFKSKIDRYTAESNALSQIGIRPVGNVSGTLAVGSAAAEFASKMSAMSRSTN